MYGCGTKRAIASGTALTQSVTATIGPSAPLSCSVTNGVRGGSDGCKRFQRSHSSASSRSCFHPGTLHTSAATS